MADDKYYCGCGHSAWGMLLLFAVIQVFLSSTLFPGIVEIFDGSIALRSSRAAVESANAGLDKYRVYDTTSNGDPTALESSLMSTSPNATTPVDPPNLDALVLAKDDADAVWGAVLARYLPGITAPSYTDVSAKVIATFINSSQFVVSGEVFVQPSNTFAFRNTATGRRVSTSIPSSVSAGKVYFSTPNNITGLNLYSRGEAEVTKLLSASLARTEAFAGFFLLQWIIGLAFFGVALKSYHTNANPAALPALSVVGLILIFFGWVVGWYYNSPWVLNTLFSTFLSSSVIGSLGAEPYVGLLILNWILLFIYSHYTIQWIAGGGQEQQGQYQEAPAAATSGGLGNTFNNLTQKLGFNSSKGASQPAPSPSQPGLNSTGGYNATGNSAANQSYGTGPQGYNPEQKAPPQYGNL